MVVIRVPRTPKKAFNEDRPASTLLLDQVKHLEWAVLPASQRKPHQLPKGAVRTEGQAAGRAAQLMKILAEQREAAAAAPAPDGVPVAAPVKLPPVPRAAAASRAKASCVRAPKRRAAARGKRATKRARGLAGKAVRKSRRRAARR